MLVLYLSMIETYEDREKVEKIYRRYVKLMKYIAMQILEREELAEDAVHDAMVRLIENLHCIKEVDSKEAKSFIAIVTQNIAVDLLRKEKRLAVEDIHDHLHKLQARTSVVDQVYANDLLEQICNLPQGLRDPLELSIYYGLNSSEIGKILGITDAAVRKRLERARERLDREKEAVLS